MNAHIATFLIADNSDGPEQIAAIGAIGLTQEQYEESNTNPITLNARVDEAAEQLMAKVNDESISYVHHKFMNDIYVVKHVEVISHIPGFTIIPSINTEDEIRSQLSKTVLSNFMEKMNVMFSTLAPFFQAVDGKLPSYYMLEFGSEYDDNNYYTDITRIYLMDEQGNSHYSALELLDDYEDVENYDTVIKEFIRNNFTISDLESYVGETPYPIVITPSSLSQEELDDIKKKVPSGAYNIEGTFSQKAYDDWLESKGIEEEE